MKNLIVSSIIFIIIFSACSNPMYTSGPYSSYSYKGNNWSFVFNDDYTFTYSARGSIESSESVGEYFITEDTLILNSYKLLTPMENNFKVFKNKRFLIEDKSIIDLEAGYVYTYRKLDGIRCIIPVDREAMRRKEFNAQ